MGKLGMERRGWLEEIGFTIVSMTFAGRRVHSVLFMGGIVGRLLPRVLRDHHGGHPDIDSCSLTLTPMLGAGFSS